MIFMQDSFLLQTVLNVVFNAIVDKVIDDNDDNNKVYSFYRIGEEKSTYTIIAECSAGHDTGTIYDYAEVIVESE